MSIDFSYTKLDEFINERLDNNRDAKVIITARNSETGTGKTTLAVLLAKYWDRNGWTSDKGYLNVKKYLAYYNKYAHSGDVLLLDDAQAGTDNRRSMKSENVALSRLWTLNRVKNVVSILALPTQSMLDKRLMELADVWIQVRRRGLAVPYRIVITDIEKDLRLYRFRYPETGLKEVIRFDAIDWCDDFVDMARKKAEHVEREYESFFDDDWIKVLEEELGEH